MPTDPFQLPRAARGLLLKLTRTDGIHLGSLTDSELAAAGELFDAELVTTTDEVLTVLPWVRVWMERAKPRPAREILETDLSPQEIDGTGDAGDDSPRYTLAQAADETTEARSIRAPEPSQVVSEAEIEASKSRRGDHRHVNPPTTIILVGVNGTWPLESVTGHLETRDAERFPQRCPGCDSRRHKGRFCLWCGGQRPSRYRPVRASECPDDRRVWKASSNPRLKGGTGAAAPLQATG